jgi:ADP-heptose:LPS heptosyltransferase
MINLIRQSRLAQAYREFRPRKEEALRGVYSRSGPLARLARYPIPMLAPWRRKEVHLLRSMGLGDVLLCTPALRELKRRNPGCIIHFYTNYPSLVQGLPYIDKIHPVSELPRQCYKLQYENAVPAQTHLSRLMGDEIGLKVSDTTPDCTVRQELVDLWISAWQGLPRPHVLIMRRASGHTPNKNWQDASWVELADCLSRSGTVIEVGGMDQLSMRPRGSYVDLRGQTNLDELVAAVAAVDLYIGPISGPMHIAAAVKTLAILIAGGYEDPEGVKYKGQTYLYTPVSCSPCWLREPCPFDLRCLAAISPGAVERCARQLLAGDTKVAREAPPRIFKM